MCNFHEIVVLEVGIFYAYIATWNSRNYPQSQVSHFIFGPPRLSHVPPPLQVFTAKGEFLRMFGKEGDGRGELDAPNGTAVDTDNTVYVCESENCHISMFTSEGAFVTSFGSKGKQPGQFNFPRDIAVDNSGV